MQFPLLTPIQNMYQLFLCSENHILCGTFSVGNRKSLKLFWAGNIVMFPSKYHGWITVWPYYCIYYKIGRRYKICNNIEKSSTFVESINDLNHVV